MTLNHFITRNISELCLLYAKDSPLTYDRLKELVTKDPGVLLWAAREGVEVSKVRTEINYLPSPGPVL